MEKFCDLLSRIFLDVFSTFSLGVPVHSSRSVLQYCLLIVNAVIPVTILVSYILRGTLLISDDALSQTTDVFELFAPVLIHMFVIGRNLKYQKSFNQINSMMQNFDEVLGNYDMKFFVKAKISSMFWFTTKFLMILVTGLGIDAFLLISLMPGNPRWQNAIRTRVLSLNVLRLMAIQFIFYCDYLTSRTSCFNQELERVGKTVEIDDKNFEQTLRSLKTLDLKLVEFSILIRNYFKWMLLLNITFNVMIVTIDFYWIYGGFIFGDNPYFLRK